jgi:hypothetical protein
MLPQSTIPEIMRRGFLLDSNRPKNSRPQNTHASPFPMSTPSEPIVRCDNVNEKCMFLAIPIDILLRIFKRVDVDERADNRYGFPLCPKKLLPVRLSHVSSRLRAIFVNEPLFWTTFGRNVLTCSPLMRGKEMRY